MNDLTFYDRLIYVYLCSRRVLSWSPPPPVHPRPHLTSPCPFPPITAPSLAAHIPLPAPTSLTTKTRIECTNRPTRSAAQRVTWATYHDQRPLTSLESGGQCGCHCRVVLGGLPWGWVVIAVFYSHRAASFLLVGGCCRRCGGSCHWGRGLSPLYSAGDREREGGLEILGLESGVVSTAGLVS